MLITQKQLHLNELLETLIFLIKNVAIKRANSIENSLNIFSIKVWGQSNEKLFIKTPDITFCFFIKRTLQEVEFYIFEALEKDYEKYNTNNVFYLSEYLNSHNNLIIDIIKLDKKDNYFKFVKNTDIRLNKFNLYLNILKNF